MPKNPATLDYAYSFLKELASTGSLPDGTPAFLFRGERSEYPQTLATIDRHCRDLGLMSNAYRQLEEVAEYALTVSCGTWEVHPRLGPAFCQHYGLPTHMFDFTSQPEVAVFFAANRLRHKAKAPRGRIALLDVARARADNFAVFDLRDFEPAKRPRVQHGFGLMRAYFGFDDILDLKYSDVGDRMGLKWLEFAHLPDDESFLYVVGAETALLSLEGDCAARMPQDLVDQYVRERGPLGRKAASILSDEIPAIGHGRTKGGNKRLWSGGRS
jgi:hypothetical protein